MVAAAPATATADDGQGLPGAWSLLVVITAVQFFNYMDRALLLALVKPIQDEFSLTDTQVGVMTGFGFALVYSAIGIPFGRLADLGFRRSLVSLCLAFWSVMTALHGAAQSFIQLVVARMAVGVGEAGCIPACISLISAYFPTRNRPLAFGIFGAGGMIGTMTGLALGSRLGELYGWRAAFYIVGLPGLILAVIAFLVMRDPVRTQADAPEAESFGKAVRGILSNGPYVWLLWAGACNTVTVYGLTQWTQLFYIRSHELTLSQAGSWVGAIYGVGMMAGILAGGALAKRMNRGTVASTLLVPLLASLVVGPLLWLALWIPDTTASLVITFVAVLLGAMAVPASLAAGQGMVAVRSRATAASMFMLMNALFGIGLSALVVGKLSDVFQASFGTDGLRIAITLIAGVNLLAAACFWRARKLADRAAL